MRITTIYALCCPDSGEERYVGVTATPVPRRLANHMYRSRSRAYKSALGVWLRQLTAQGKAPTWKVLEQTTGDGRVEEKKHIERLTSAGIGLVNMTRGGNGAHLRRGLPPEAQTLLGVLSDARIAEQFGVCRETVTYHRQRENIPASGDRSRVVPPSQVPGFVPHNKVDLSEDVLGSLGVLSDRELARQAGVSRGVVRNRRKAAGVVPTSEENRPTGEAHGQAKLTWEQVLEIRAEYVRYSREHGCGAIARRLGLDTSTVHDIIRGNTWRE